MKFSVDTNNFENIKLEINDEEFNDPQNLITDFCFATASFYLDLAQKIGANISQVQSFKKVCVPLIDQIINSAIDDGMFDDGTESSEQTGISQEELDELRVRLENSNLSDDKVDVIIKAASSFNSIEEFYDFIDSI